MKKGKLATLLISGAIGFLVLGLWVVGMLDKLEYRTYDWMFTLRGPIQASQDIVIVAFDEESFKVLGRWPWTRAHYAKVIDKLTDAGAKALVFDVMYPEPESEHPGVDETFGEAMKRSGRVVLASYFKYDIEGNPIDFLEPIPVLRQNGVIGFANIVPELDGVCRKIPLFKVYKNKTVPSLAMGGVGTYLGKAPEAIAAEKQIKLDQYNEMLINYSGGYESFKYYSFFKVLDGSIPAATFRGKIVLFGGTASGLFDFKAIPYAQIFPGVEIHANTISNVLLGNAVRPISAWVTFLLIVLFACVSGFVSGRLSPLKGGIITFVLMTGTFAAVFSLFKYGNMHLEFVAPAGSLGLSYIGVLFYRFMTEEQEKRKIKKTFSQYLSPKIMEKVLNDPSYLKMGGNKENLTVLFSDIRGFTTITESTPSEELVPHLNEYLSKMVEVVFKWDGTLDKFIGDSVMAFWGAPIPQNDHQIRGVLCAIDMHKELKILQDKWKAEGKKIFEIGVGVNSGDMIVGNIGSTGKKDFTVIGDSVNLGARLESTTKEYHAKIIISEATYLVVKDLIDAKHIGSVKVKGKTKAVEIYAVLGKKGEEPIISADQIHKDEPEIKTEVPKPAAPAAPAAPVKFNPDERTMFPKK
jgi:adenylate cyclase